MVEKEKKIVVEKGEIENCVTSFPFDVITPAYSSSTQVHGLDLA